MNRETHDPRERFTLAASERERDGVRCFAEKERKGLKEFQPLIDADER